MSTNSSHVRTLPIKKSRTVQYIDCISDLPQDVIGHILCRLPAKDVVQTSVFSRDWKHKWIRWIESHGDRITTLPDEVVSHVFSRLLMTDVVRMRVLSRIWEKKWTSIHDIDICDKRESLRGHKADERRQWFSDFGNVQWVLLRTRSLRSFRLRCSQSYFSDCLETLISNVLTRKVQNLCLIAPAVLEDWRCYSDWNSLTKLTLVIDCTLRIPNNNCFPNLKNLHLLGYYSRRRIKIRNERILLARGQMLLNFPVLEVLELGCCMWVLVASVEIHAPKLIEFKAHHLWSKVSGDCEIKIFGPKLAKFESAGGRMSNFVLSAPAVTYAVLNHYTNGVVGDLALLTGDVCQFGFRFEQCKEP